MGAPNGPVLPDFGGAMQQHASMAPYNGLRLVPPDYSSMQNAYPAVSHHGAEVLAAFDARAAAADFIGQRDWLFWGWLAAFAVGAVLKAVLP